MSGKTVEEVLRSFGLTEKEIEIYIFLAKHKIQKGGEIARKTKIAKAVVYRILKILQRKGFVESTLESPARYTAIPFETIIDLNIKTKHEEASQIESAKADLLIDWSRISKGSPELPVEKFAVIEGPSKIFAKYYQIIKQTKNQLYAISSISEMLDAYRYGVFSAVPKNGGRKTPILIKFIVDLANLDLKSAKQLRARLKFPHDLRIRNPSLMPGLFPHMIIRDGEEIILRLSGKEEKGSYDEQSCLLTNCKSIIQSFSSVFEELWLNSTDIKHLEKTENEEPAPETQVIRNPIHAKTLYLQALDSTKYDILIVTSSNGLKRLLENEIQFEKWRNKGIQIKIMAPIVTTNIESTKKLLNWGEVRHIPLGYFETTIIDQKHLFQFEHHPKNKTKEELNFHNMFYTNDLNHIKETSKLLQEIWKKTRIPRGSARLIIEPNLAANRSTSKSVHPSLDNTKFMIKKHYSEIKLTRNDVFDKIAKEKELPDKQPVSWFETVKLFGCRGFGIIHASEHFNLPDIVIGAIKNEKESSFGSSNQIIVLANTQKSSGYTYVPVAIATDNSNPNSLASLRFSMTGTPAEKNVNTFKKDEIQIKAKGKTMFAGWTRPIPLGSLNKVLPASCIIFEGYGKCKHGVFTSCFPSGRKHEVWYLTYDAFLTFYHPEEKYIGNGTDAFFDPYAFQLLYPTTKGKEA